MSNYNVPEGWTLVPVEPTREMLVAANKADDKAYADGRHHGADNEDIWHAMLATAPAAPLAHAGQRERVLVEREQLERAASVVAWMSCRSDIKAADMKRLEQCASELSCALAAPPAHPDAPRCQCCGYLVTQSEHRGCLRSASPHPVASVLVEALRAARHLLALHSGEAMPAYDAMQVVDRIDAALAGKGGGE